MRRPKVGVVDYGVMGNLFSVSDALQHAGFRPELVTRPEYLARCDGVVLPGVGNFHAASTSMWSSGMMSATFDFSKTGKPVLGICLGMQLLSEEGAEGGHSKGLGLLKGKVKRMEDVRPLPSMGFKSVGVLRRRDLFGVSARCGPFYFMHSYEFSDSPDVLAYQTCGARQVVAAVGNSNVLGVQFHPEKSREHGISFLTRVFQSVSS